MESIMTDDMTVCFVCRRRADDLHHVLHGADKKLSEKYGLMVPLCRGCHNKVHHVDGELDHALKQEAQREFLRKTFGKCYV